MYIVRELDLMFWVGSIAITLFLGVFTQMKLHYQKTDDEILNGHIRTWSYFFFFTAAGNAFGLLNRLIILELPSVDPNLPIIIDQISITLDLTAIAIKIYYIEKIMKFFKRPYLTYYNIAEIIFGWVLWGQNKEPGPIPIIYLALNALAFLMLPLIHIYIAKKTSGTLRWNALKIAIGLIVLELALSLQAHNLALVFPNFSADWIAMMGFPFQIISPTIVWLCAFLIYRGYSNQF